MLSRNLGQSGISVSAIGLGCMGLSEFYGEPTQESEAINLLHRAVDLGIIHFGRRKSMAKDTMSNYWVRLLPDVGAKLFWRPSLVPNPAEKKQLNLWCYSPHLSFSWRLTRHLVR